jgi:translation elongation factor EF-1beta
MMATPRPNEICNDYILQPQESDIEHEGKVYRKQEEVYRGSFGTTYMFKTEDAKFGLTKIAVKAGIPQEENSQQRIEQEISTYDKLRSKGL